MSERQGLWVLQERPLDLIAMGRVAVDLYGEQIGAPLKDVQTFRKYLGGCAGNIAVGASRLGLRVSMLSMVGSDAMGQFIGEQLSQEKVDITHLQRSDAHLTGLVILGVCPPDRFPLIFYRNDCADLAIDKDLITKDYVASAQGLLVTGTGFSHPRSKAATLHAMKLASETSTKVILDIDYRPVLWSMASLGDGEKRYVKNAQVSQTLAEILPLTDLIVGTEEEFLIASGESDLPSALSKLRSITSAPLVLKQGAEGATAFFGDERVKAQGFLVKLVNVLGAGDAFMAGLLSALLRNKTFAEALRRANAAGALVVSRHGCAPAMPSKPELDYFLKRDQDLHPDAKLEHLHHLSKLKNYKREGPLAVLAFCHRWQLEESLKHREDAHFVIASFKRAIAEAAHEAALRHGIKAPAIIADPIYGQEAIDFAKETALGIFMALEKSGQEQSEWYEEGSAYEILLKWPPSFAVKVLWHFHGDLPFEKKHHQLTRLKEVSRACLLLDRYLLLEVVLSPAYPQAEDEILRAVKEVYEAGVKPYWWKLSSFNDARSYQDLAQLIDHFDPDARVLLLGGQARDLSAYRSSFSLAKASHHVIGFAVGRSIFWPSWQAYVEKKISFLEVKEAVANKFSDLYQLWLDS